MLVLIGAGNQNVIQIDKDALQATQNAIHQALKRLGRVLEAEWHPQELEEAEWSDDRRLLDVLRRHGDLVISPYQVQHRKESGTEGHGGKGVDVGKGIAIVSSGDVELPIITTRTPTTMCLGHHMKRGCPRSVGGPNDPHLHHLGKLIQPNEKQSIKQ